LKKFIVVIIFGILLLSGVQAININKIENKNSISDTYYFSNPALKNQGEYLTLEVKETLSSLMDPGKPEMPMFTQSYYLPFGAKDIEIRFNALEENELDVEGFIKPTPQPVENVDNICNTKSFLIKDKNIYSTDERYPTSWFDYKITCGLYPNIGRTTRVSVYIYPVQYNPKSHKLFFINKAELEISYNPNENKRTFEEEYDLVIIAPQSFSSALKKLVDHKNSIGIKTFLKTTDEIFNQYTGFDKPEEIKYFIKDAIETYNITNVLLVGGLKSLIYARDRDDCNQGTKDWHLPVRYTNVRKSGLHDEGAISDIYFADVYKEGGEFENWDSNGDGVLAKYTSVSGKDILDLDPDVYVGRLPCRNTWEVKKIVNKIIVHDISTPNSKAWYNRMIGISGLSHAIYGDKPDGELLTDIAFSYVDDIIDEEVKLYASNAETGGPTPEPADITKAFTDGARYVYFSGHGNPIVWVTHPITGTDTWMERFYGRDMWRFFNFNKLPIVIVGGCHDGQFNITFLTTLFSSRLGEDKWYWTHGDPGCECFCWKMMTVPWGGAVATVGGTGLTTSYSGKPNTLNAELATNFFYMIGQENATTFGEAFHGAQQKFLENNNVRLLETHAYTIWNPMGDPTLKLT
jgi:hypothetical protein